MKSRYAPTPSGYLHVGNAWNFFLIWVYTRAHKGKIFLRIDDGDSSRVRPEYLEDIFASLSWLGLDWDEGPQNLRDFQISFTAASKLTLHKSVWENFLVQNFHLVYPCTCSRLTLKAESKKSKALKSVKIEQIIQGDCLSGKAKLDFFCSNHSCPGKDETLYKKRESSFPGKAPLTPLKFFTSNDENPSAWRLYGIKIGEAIEGPNLSSSEESEPILWKKNDTPSYHWASTIDDHHYGINTVIRGADLENASALHLILRKLLGYNLQNKQDYFHHALVRDKNNLKLSKSKGAQSLQSLRVQGRKGEDLLAFFVSHLNQRLQTQFNLSDLSDLLTACTSNEFWNKLLQISAPNISEI